jgi:hypothetical protein
MSITSWTMGYKSNKRLLFVGKEKDKTLGNIYKINEAYG